MALLADVIARPDDGTARMVYADQLQSAGDPRGELIAVSCAHAACGDDDPRRRELARRELALMRALLPAWLAELGMADVPAWLARGFPDYVDIWSHQLAPIAESLWARVPLSRMYLRGMTPADAARLRALGPTPLRELALVEIGTPAIDEAATLELLTSPWMSNAHAIDVSGVALGDEHFVALVESDRLPQLQRLAMYRGKQKLTRTGLTAAMASPTFRKLRELRLTKFALKAPGARCFAKATCAERLETLALAECGLGAEGAQLVLESAALPALANLSLRENKLGTEAPVTVGPELASSLRRLELSLNEIDDAWIRDFLATRPLAVTHLGLRSNHLTADGVRAIVEAPQLAQLEVLTVSAQDRNRAPWGAELASIVELPGFARLRGLDAALSEATADSITALARSPNARNLRRLALGFNKIGIAGARAIVDSESLANLECLELPYCDLHDDGIEALCTGRRFPKLRYLHLAGNGIGQRGFAALERTTAFPALRVLKLYEAKGPQRVAIERNLGALLDAGDFTSSMGRWFADDELLV